MKKNGFTLAEVLITLAIIGVVATLTLPALMTNTAEQQAKTAFKKGINTLTEAAQMNQAIAGFDYASISSDKTDDSTESDYSLFRLLADRASIDFATSNDEHKLNVGAADSANFTVFFRDGSALSFKATDTIYNAAPVGNGTHTGITQISTPAPDGLPYGYAALFDYNGKKGPNQLSNCEGDLTLKEESEHDISKCDDKTKRLIKDQFAVRLRGSYAVPNGAAARWAFTN